MRRMQPTSLIFEVPLQKDKGGVGEGMATLLKNLS